MTRRCDVCAFWERWADTEHGTARGECRRNAPTPVQQFQVQLASLLGSIAWLAEEDADVEHNCPEYSFETKSQFFIYEWPLTESDDWCGEFKRECKGDTP